MALKEKGRGRKEESKQAQAPHSQCYKVLGVWGELGIKMSFHTCNMFADCYCMYRDHGDFVCRAYTCAVVCTMPLGREGTARALLISPSMCLATVRQEPTLSLYQKGYKGASTEGEYFPPQVAEYHCPLKC